MQATTIAETKRDGANTTAPVESPPEYRPGNFTPEFCRLPKPGQLCPYTGLSRAALNALILPTDANGHKPPVKSFCLRQPGARTGIRLISYQHLREYILAHVENGEAGGEA